MVGLMLQKKVLKGIKELTTMMYMLADDIGLIDVESVYSDKIKNICGAGDWPAEVVPSEVKNVKKLPAEIRETDEAIIVTIEFPGVEKKDIDIITTDEALSVRAKRYQRPEVQYERYYDLFCGNVKLPCAIKKEGVKASFNNGLLIIALPKEVMTPRTKISIE
jgi:HSP20 family molecular chaperone IbpA